MKKKTNLEIVVSLLVLVTHEIFGRNYVSGNNGVSFGWTFPYISLVIILVLVMVLREWFRDKSWGWWMVLVGGVINFIDRLRFGFVRDYWDLGFGINNNINDWVIAFGVVILIRQLWKQKL